MKKSILIICYSFPPNKGIGGRRWAKFAKHMANAGFEVNVICKQPQEKDVSEWTQDTLHPSIILHPLPANYPTILTTIPTTFIQKLNYRIWLLVFKFLSKGTFPERTFFWKKQLLKKATELIEQKKIKTIIATVPPFRIGYYASFLKLKFPDVNFILDYRDPWTDNKTFHGFMNLSPKRLAHELKMEVTALNLADCVITANEQMTSWLKEKIKSSDKHFITLPNGYDSDDIVSAPELPKTPSPIRQFIYAGTFYSNVEYILIPFLKAIKKQEETNPTFQTSFKFDFYGDMDPKMKSLFNQYQLKTVKLNAPVSLKKIQQKIQQSDFCLMFAAHDHSFAFNTKFYEYLANRKPIVIFSKQGEVPTFLESNKLGVAINFETFEIDFENLIRNVQNKTMHFNSTFKVDQFSTFHHFTLLNKQLV